MNIVFGICGESQRFRDAGYSQPKYLIEYLGHSMIYHAVKTLKIPGKIYFIVRQQHLDQYQNLEQDLLSIGDEIIASPGPTSGAAATLLLTQNHIDHDEPLLSVNCDQYIDWDSKDFIAKLSANRSTSYVLTFKSDNPSYSYIKIKNNQVIELKEKERISDLATCGMYHWARAGDFFQDAQQMIFENKNSNKEHYVAPVYNYSIARGVAVDHYEIDQQQFWPVGTPGELDKFLKDYENSKCKNS